MKLFAQLFLELTTSKGTRFTTDSLEEQLGDERNTGRLRV